jgi:GTP cyclohydrolase II
MGLPVVIDMPQPLVVCAAETLTQDRLNALRELGEVQAVLSKWRADTLKISAYDGTVARIFCAANVRCTLVPSGGRSHA